MADGKRFAPMVTTPEVVLGFFRVQFTRRISPDMMLGGGYFYLLYQACAQGRDGSFLVLGLMAVISFLAWRTAYKHARLVMDNPTSKVASAAQGYVELLGKTRRRPDEQVVAPYSHTPCVWCRYSKEELVGDSRLTVASGETAATFVLEDSTGRCLVDPEGAIITTSHKAKWREGKYDYTEWRLLEDEPIYVLGEFRTLSSKVQRGEWAHDPLRTAQAFTDLIREFVTERVAQREDCRRQSRAASEVQEWFVKRMKDRWAEKGYDRIPDAAQMGCVRAPGDGRKFLISNLPPVQMVQNYVRWTRLHLAVFIGAACSLAALWVLT